jgi:hypothetical protein
MVRNLKRRGKKASKEMVGGFKDYHVSVSDRR